MGEEFGERLRAAQQGDAEAFSALWRDTQPMLLRYLRPLARSAADDVASDAWLAVLQGLRRFRGGEAEFRAWLFTIARRKLIDQQRRDQARPTSPLDDSPAEPLAPDTADVAAERMGTNRVVALLGRLPAEQAEILLLRLVGGLDVASVARITGRSPGAVRVAAHRALRRLEALLAEEAVTAGALEAFHYRDG